MWGMTDRISVSCENASSAKFHFWAWEKNKTCADISSDVKHFILSFKKKYFVKNVQGWGISPHMCHDYEYKRMDQDKESWSVVQCTELNKDPLQANQVGPTLFLQQ